MRWEEMRWLINTYKTRQDFDTLKIYFDFDTCCLYTYYDLTRPLYSFTMFTFHDFYICLLFFMNFYTALAVSLPLPHAYFFVLLVFLDILFPFIYVRKLPWLSRQSDRLLTDRSLVRSQAEAPFFTFIPTFFLLNIYNDKKYASRGSRTHDRAVKSRALYRLS